MNTNTQRKTEDANPLRLAFEEIQRMEAAKAEIAQQITDAIDEACERLSIQKKAFKAALKWYGMSEGERSDFEAALQMATDVLRSAEQPDMFSGPGESLGQPIDLDGRRRARRKLTDDD
jgi:uncharacterized protein (UPF0335 family)